MDDLFCDQAEPSDEALVAAVTERDVAALVALHRRYAQPAYALAAHLLGRAEAEEAVQEAFLRVWKNAAQFDHSRGPFRVWFFAIVRNHVSDRLRRRGRGDVLAKADEIETLLSAAPDPEVDVEEEVWRRDRAATVLDALKRLPPEQRRVLVLAYFGHGLSQSSIAEHLGWPLGTVKKRTRLALQKLRRVLDGQWSTAVVMTDRAGGEGTFEDGV